MAADGGALVDLQPVYIKPYRAINGIVADVVISEEHDDDCDITRQPVEFGSVISDNIVKEPAVLTVTQGWSLGGPNNIVGDPEFLKLLYQTFLNLQVNGVVFAVYTGKRYYPFMAVRGLNVRTDRETENVLYMKVVLQEIIFVTTSTIQLSNSAVQALPQNTQFANPTGNTSLLPSTQDPPPGVDPSKAGPSA